MDLVVNHSVKDTHQLIHANLENKGDYYFEIIIVYGANSSSKHNALWHESKGFGGSMITQNGLYLGISMR